MIRITLMALAALTLAGCGRQGDLARPGPLFGRGEAPAEASEAVQPDRDGDRVEGTERTPEGVGGTGTRNATDLDPNRTLDPASAALLEGVNDPVGDRPPVTPPNAG